MEKIIVLGQGRQLFKQGEKGGDLFFIKEGEVDLVVHNEETGAEVTVATLGPKSVIGSMSFLENDPRSATALTKTEVKYIQVTQTQKKQLLNQVPSWLHILLKDLSSNLRRTNTTLVKLNEEFDLTKKKLGVKDKQKKDVEDRMATIEKEAADQKQADDNEKAKLKEQIKDLNEQIAEAAKAGKK